MVGLLKKFRKRRSLQEVVQDSNALYSPEYLTLCARSIKDKCEHTAPGEPCILPETEPAMEIAAYRGIHPISGRKGGGQSELPICKRNRRISRMGVQRNRGRVRIPDSGGKGVL